jgi:hypothetical protein
MQRLSSKAPEAYNYIRNNERLCNCCAPFSTWFANSRGEGVGEGQRKEWGMKGIVNPKQCEIHKNATKNRWLLLLKDVKIT